MLQLLNVEREYIQLHRDTTVASLTVAPSLERSALVYHDSPLVKAMKHGRCLVVDEADKAPAEVVVVLKGLLADGEMRLADGRRFVANRQPQPPHQLPIHPDFRVIALANRPGFPFLGNDLFDELGDVFRTFVVDNPDLDSELALLRAHAPDVPPRTLRRVARAFAELRSLSDRGELTYPFSTREAVAVARHLNAHPDDGAAAAVANVSAFDAFTPASAEAIEAAFQRQGIDIRAAASTRQLKPLGLALQLVFAHAVGRANPVARV